MAEIIGGLLLFALGASSLLAPIVLATIVAVQKCRRTPQWLERHSVSDQEAFDRWDRAISSVLNDLRSDARSKVKPKPAPAKDECEEWFAALGRIVGLLHGRVAALGASMNAEIREAWELGGTNGFSDDVIREQIEWIKKKA